MAVFVVILLRGHREQTNRDSSKAEAGTTPAKADRDHHRRRRSVDPHRDPYRTQLRAHRRNRDAEH